MFSKELISHYKEESKRYSAECDFKFRTFHELLSLFPSINTTNALKNNCVYQNIQGFEEMDTSGYCEDAEDRHFDVLNPSNEENYRNGYLVIVKNQIVGHVKTRHQTTFIAWENVKNTDYMVLLSGGIYHLSKKTIREIRKKRTSTGKWNLLKLDDLVISPCRMINEDYSINGIKNIRKAIREEKARLEKELELV